MDSKTKAIAARIPIQDYEHILFDSQRLGIKLNDWLICKIYGYPLPSKCNSLKEATLSEDFFAFPDKKDQEIIGLLEEIKKLKDINDGIIKRYNKLERESSSKSRVIDKLEYLLSRYNKNWREEYEDL